MHPEYKLRAMNVVIIEYNPEKFEQVSRNHLDVQEELEQISIISGSVTLNWVQRIPETKAGLHFLSYAISR